MSDQEVRCETHDLEMVFQIIRTQAGDVIYDDLTCLHCERDQTKAEERERCARLCEELAEKTQDAFRIIKEEAAILGMWELDRLSEHHRVYQHAAKKIREKKEE